jgi:hypothetical protein
MPRSGSKISIGRELALARRSLRAVERGLMIVGLLLACGCATVPLVRSWRPWLRTLSDNNAPPPRVRISVAVEGVTDPLIGDESLFRAEIRQVLAGLMERRGYLVGAEPAEWEAKLFYRTTRRDKNSFAMSVVSSQSSLQSSRAQTGLGVILASAIAAASSHQVLATRSSQTEGYEHVVALEIRGPSRTLDWKGESAWWTRSVDLRDGLVPAVEQLLCRLPTSGDVAPTIERIKESHIGNYYRLYCSDQQFSCPSLPYVIWFPSVLSTDLARASESRTPADWVEPRRVERRPTLQHSYALAAYRDLVQTAEYALPTGSEKSWKDPLKATLWKRATLAGRYRLGGTDSVVYAMVELTGEAEGYLVKHAWCASEEEWRAYNQRLEAWRRSLSRYYDVYSH